MQINLTPSTSRHDTVGIFGVVKIEIVAPVEGKKWPIGHTVLVDDQSGQQLIDEGVAIIHPTVSDLGPTHPCPCEDETAEPCEECQEKAEAMDGSTKKLGLKMWGVLWGVFLQNFDVTTK